MNEASFRAFLIERNVKQHDIENRVRDVVDLVKKDLREKFGILKPDESKVEEYAKVLRRKFSKIILLNEGKGTLEDFSDSQ